MSCTGFFSVAKWRKFAKKNPSLSQEVPHQNKKLGYPKTKNWNALPSKPEARKHHIEKQNIQKEIGKVMERGGTYCSPIVDYH